MHNKWSFKLLKETKTTFIIAILSIKMCYTGSFNDSKGIHDNPAESPLFCKNHLRYFYPTLCSHIATFLQRTLYYCLIIR